MKVVNGAKSAKYFLFQIKRYAVHTKVELFHVFKAYMTENDYNNFEIHHSNWVHQILFINPCPAEPECIHFKTL